MGKHNKKTGRERLDKYYQMAKSQGYRARSSFKLVHLNRKYDLLAKSRVVIDLCAAPGGWLQVAQKYCPQQSLIVGVDLDAIRPIPGVHTFVGDITTQACRTSLKGYLKHFQADLVLHDGAPNVGTAWIQDAFTQSELTLQSLKLATEFLKKGGAFVTKVFRSGDYNSLMWVFNQLFAKVEATKPPSSRNVSAEIFVVCQDFRAPKYIDPKFLDPKHVFKELSNSNAPLPLSITLDPSSTQASSSSNLKATTNGLTNSGASLALNGTTNIFAPEKKRRAREGYAEGDYTLYRTLPVRSLVHANGLEAVTVLSSCNALEWAPKGESMGEEEKVWFDSRHTDDDIKESMKDLRVLGKGEFRRLMKWRLAIRLQTGLDVKKTDVEEDTEGKVTIEEPVDEETQVTEEMKRLHEENSIKAKRLKKRQNEKKARTIQRLQLGMTAPEDMVLEDDAALRGEDMFDLGTGENEVKRKGMKGKGLADLVKDTDGMDEEDQAESEDDEDEDEYLSSDDEREAKTAYLEGELDGLYDAYKERMNERDAKWKVKQARLQDRNRDAWHGIRDEDEDGENDGIVKVQGHGVGQADGGAGAGGEDEGEESEEGGWDLVASHKAKIGEEVDSDDDSDSEHSGEEDGAPRVKRVRLALPGHATSAAAVRAMQMANKSKQNLVTNLGADVEKAEMSRQAQVWFDQSIFKDVGDLADLDAGDEEEEESDDEMDGDEESGEESDVDMAEADIDGSEHGEDDFEVVPVQEDDGMQWDIEDEDQDEVKRQKIQKKGLLTAEAVTLATAIVNRKLTADQMIDDGFNKHNFNHKDGLPTWFLDDEGKYYKPNLPVTKEAIQALRAKQRALDARPIKKVAEAKARKKMKASMRMEKAKRKMDGLTDAPDMNERDKATQMMKLLGKAAGKPKKKEVAVVVAKGVNKGVKGRPKGVKGRYKIVDPRMRKEMRALKRIAKRDKKRRH